MSPQPIDWSAEANAARLADLRFMVDTNETLDGACTRLGLTPDALWQWCKRNGHTDLYQRLQGERLGHVRAGRVAVRL